MEKYNFEPKVMLREVCESLLHVCPSKEFQDAAVNDAFFKNAAPLTKAIKVVTKHNLMTPSDVAKLIEFKDKLILLAVDAADLDELLNDAPSEFLDPLLDELMHDPVELPSGNILDRSTIIQQLLNDPIDPFNRAPMTMSDVKPCTELQGRIQHWIASKKAEKIATMNKSLERSSPPSPAPENAAAVTEATQQLTKSDDMTEEEREIQAAIELSLQED